MMHHPKKRPARVNPADDSSAGAVVARPAGATAASRVIQPGASALAADTVPPRIRCHHRSLDA